jgi:phosphatidate cytidylyltransferase
MGLVMVLLTAGFLLADGYLAHWLGFRFYPCLFVSYLLLTVLACLELHSLLPGTTRPPLWLALAGTCALALTGWPAHLELSWLGSDPWRHLAWMFAGLVLAGFLYEMAVYQGTDGAVVRCALFVWMLAYLGLLPAFLVQLRFWPADAPRPELHGAAALALVIFVPKCGDIGAYFTGRYLGRHPMTPRLSPKKTWEGLAGGLAASMVTALVLNLLVPMFRWPAEAALFGLAVGTVGVLGDLAESMIKRDCGAKDASQVVPGFGGILDVVDSVLFAAPLAYWWLEALRSAPA